MSGDSILNGISNIAYVGAVEATHADPAVAQQVDMVLGDHVLYLCCCVWWGGRARERALSEVYASFLPLC